MERMTVRAAPCVMFDFGGLADYAKRGGERRAERPAVDGLPSIH